MKAKRTVSVDQIGEAENGILDIEDVKIAGGDYHIQLINPDRSEKGKESLIINFNDGDYIIRINEEGVRFHRTLYRPGHDHNDSESLQEEKKSGKRIWCSGSPYPRDKYEHLHIPFGSRTEGEAG